MAVAGGRLDLGVAEEVGDHRQAQAERERPGGERVTQAIQAGVFEPGLPTVDRHQGLARAGGCRACGRKTPKGVNGNLLVFPTAWSGALQRTINVCSFRLPLMGDLQLPAT